MKKSILLSLLMFSISPIFSQSSYNDDARSTLGIGLGLDYGGIGFKFTQLVDPHFGLTLGGGYAFAGFGYNVGGIVKIRPEARVVPTISFMYGYNAAVAVSNASQFNKFFYGPSLGFGILSKRRNNPQNYWQFELILPIRSGDVDAYLNTLRNSGVSIGSLSPVGFTIGYNFGL